MSVKASYVKASQKIAIKPPSRPPVGRLVKSPPTKVWIDGRPAKPCTVDDRAREFFRKRLAEKAAIEEAALSIQGIASANAPRPVVILTLGAPGCGKTTALSRLYPEQVRNYFVIDPDEIVEQIDVYRQSLDIHDPGFKACNLVVGLKEAWRDCINSAVNFSSDLVQEAIQKGVNVIVDQPFAGSRFANVFEQAGYRVILLHIHAPPAEILERTKRRAERTGRFQPFYKTVGDVIDMMQKTRQQFIDSVPYASEAYEIDTGTPKPTVKPCSMPNVASRASPPVKMSPSADRPRSSPRLYAQAVDDYAN